MNWQKTGQRTAEWVARIFARSGQELENALEQIRPIEVDLTKSSKVFENQFLRVFGNLEALQVASEELSNESSTMLELSQGDENPISSVSNKLEPNLNFISKSATEIESMVEVLETNNKSIDTTLSFEAELDKTFSQLTYIRTLFAVEAAPLEQNAKVMFTSLVEEIHRLQKDVSEIFAENFSAMRANRRTIKSLADSLQDQAKEQHRIYADSQLEMDTVIQAQTKVLDRDIATNSSFKNYSDDISNAIGTAIISLQSQDIIAQKMQHIFEVSEEMRERFSKARTLKAKIEKCSEYRFIEHAALVNLNQIDAIKTELQESDRSIERSVGQISDSINSMDTVASESRRKQLRDGAEKQRGLSLLVALEKAGETISKTNGFLEQAFKTIEPMRGQATNVSSTIEQLSSQLHLIGLNAEIHAARTGESTALETLSAKTSSISVETRELCRQISEQLDTLAKALHGNVNQIEELSEEAREAYRSIRSDIPAETSNLRNQNDQYNASQVKAAQLHEELRIQMRNQDAQLDFEATMITELEAMQDIQLEVSRLAKAAADRLKVKVSVPDTMEGLLARYTMVSEKSVHMQTLGIDTFGTNDSVDSAANLDIDFFEIEPEEDETMLDQGVSLERASAGVDFFAEEEETANRNVEFF